MVKDGRFQYTEDLERDGYPELVPVEADGYLPAESKVYHKEDGHVELVFRLKKGSDIRETLVTSQGKPLAEADVLVVNESSQIIIEDGTVTRQTFTLRTRSDADGRFRVPPQAGDYRLMVVHPQGFADLSPKELGGGAADRRAALGQVDGIARDGSKPASGRTVIALRDRVDRQERGRIDISSKATVSDDGHFRIEHVLPGPTEVAFYVELASTATGWSYGFVQPQKFEAKAGETARVEVGGSGRPVMGRVVVPPSISGQIDWLTSRCQISSRAAPAWPRPSGQLESDGCQSESAVEQPVAAVARGAAV